MRELPLGDGWAYEPKWDGFRGVLENAGGELRLWSRNGRPLLRYFPELRPLGELLPPRSALDGEIVIDIDGAIDFDAMQTRLHPAESRIRKLSAEIPARFVAFDTLVWDGVAAVGEAVRRATRRARARRRGLLALAVGGRPRDRDGVARRARGARPRRRRREAARPARRAGRPWRRRQGEARAHRRLRRRGRAVEVEARGDCDVAPRPLRRRRRDRLRGLGRGGREPPRRDRRAGAAAPRRDLRPSLLGAEPLGRQRARGAAVAPRARGRGALRQGAGPALPARHQAAALPARQGSARVHVGGAPSAARCRRADRRRRARTPDSSDAPGLHGRSANPD